MPWISLPDELVEVSRLIFDPSWGAIGPGSGCTSADINRSKEFIHKNTKKYNVCQILAKSCIHYDFLSFWESK